MVKDLAGIYVRVCSTRATCEHARGIACLVCARGIDFEDKLSSTRNSPAGMKESCLKIPSDRLQRKQFCTMDNTDNSHNLVDNVCNFDFDEPLTKLSPADSKTAFLTATATTCQARQFLSYQMFSAMSPPFLPASLTELASSMFERHRRYSEGCSRSYTRNSRTSQSLKMGIFLMLFLASLLRPSMASMDITAFEYQRKFHKVLDLGECSQREVIVKVDNTTFVTEEQRCTLQQRGTVTNFPRELDDSRNVLISSPDGIIANLGLCGGEAASFLGILNNGDCVAVEIASKLTFSEKTLVRAFVGYYRKSLDILERSGPTLEGMEQYYKDKFYLKSRSYGTLEIILVQLRFDTVRDAEEAKTIQLPKPAMSDYMRQIERRIGIPKNTLVINFSTATQETFDLKAFTRETWERAVRDVEILQLNIQKTRGLINTNAITPHLQYSLHPFLDSTESRLTKPVHWEESSMLEVKLRSTLKLAKNIIKLCKPITGTSKDCKRMKELKRQMAASKAEIHKSRSNWMTLTAEEKDSFATRYTAKVNTFANVTKSLAKSVRQAKKKEERKVLDQKRNKLNEIPLATEAHIEKPQHRIRHARRRNKVRKDLGS